MTERVKQALKRAVGRARNMPLRLPEKVRAVETLVHAALRLGSAEQKPDDMDTSVLIVHLNEKKYAEIKAILDANSALRSLCYFGSVPRWVLIEAVFKSADVKCPIELRCFHEAYQEELQTLS